MLTLFLFISFLNCFQVIVPDFSDENQHPIKRKNQYEELFVLYVKNYKKHYVSLSETKFRYNVFKNNLFRFISKNQSLKNKVYLKGNKENGYKLFIVPDSTISAFLNENLIETINDNSTKFELNKFTDLSDEEFDTIYTLDEKYFTDEYLQNPIKNELIKIQSDNLLHLKEYIKNIVKHDPELLKRNKKIIKSLEKIEDLNHQGLKETPHLSTHPEHNSKWTAEEDEHNNIFTSNQNLNNDFFGYSRMLEESQPIILPETLDFVSIDGVQVPAEINWKDLGALTPIKNQKKCNACYAFAAIGAVEAHHKIKTGETVSLSEQEIVDCSTENNRCSGGLPNLVFDYIKNKNISYTNDYKYDAQKYERCRINRNSDKYNGTNINSYYNLPKGILHLIKNLANGPIAVISYASREFKSYGGGLFKGQGCFLTWRVNHASLLVGYKLTGEKYFLFKNGWGSDWGEDGYYKVQIKSLNGSNKGHCHIAGTTANSSPIFK